VLYREIVGRLKQDDASVPYFKDGYWYYTRFETGKEHPIFARRKITLEAPEEIVIDGNDARRAAARRATNSINSRGRGCRPTASGWRFCEDFVGRRQYELRFSNLRTHEVFENPIRTSNPPRVGERQRHRALRRERPGNAARAVREEAHARRGSRAPTPWFSRKVDTSFL